MLAICRSCKKKLRLPSDFAAQKFRCPLCGAVSQVDHERATADPPEAQPIEESTAVVEPERPRRRREGSDAEEDDRPRRGFRKKRKHSGSMGVIAIAVSAVVVLAGLGGLVIWLLAPVTNSRLTADNIEKTKTCTKLEEMEEILGKARVATDSDINDVNAKMQETARRSPAPPPRLVAFRPGAAKYMWRNQNTWLFVDVDDKTKAIVGRHMFSVGDPRQLP